MDGIVVGLDESRQAAQALRWAADYGARHGLPVTGVLAWGFLDQHHVDEGHAFDPNYGEPDAEAVLTELIGRAVGPGSAVTGKVVCDLPARALIEAGSGASLLAVGARGLGGFRGLLLGSVSRQVVHHASCPVAIVHVADESLTRRNIVVGVDGSPTSRAALSWALDEARSRQAPLVAVHAWRASSDTDSFYAPVVDVDTVHEAARQLLDQEIDEADTHGLPTPVERSVVAGGGAPALLHIAEDAALIVVGSRGLGGFKGLLLGSVSDQVANHARCPVVVVPAPASSSSGHHTSRRR